MRITLNEKELAMLVHLIWEAESEGEFGQENSIKVYVGNPDGSEDYLLPTTEKEFYALQDKITNSLSKEFKKNKGEKWETKLMKLFMY